MGLKARIEKLESNVNAEDIPEIEIHVKVCDKITEADIEAAAQTEPQRYRSSIDGKVFLCKPLIIVKPE